MTSDRLPTYQFDGCTLRPATLDDFALATAWCAADPDHTWEAQYKYYWVEQKMGANCYVFEDGVGPVFFLKIIRAEDCKVELNLQFDRSFYARLRMAEGLKVCFAWLEKHLGQIGFKAVYFLSANPNLTRFCEAQLGFVKTGDRWQKALHPAAPLQEGSPSA